MGADVRAFLKRLFPIAFLLGVATTLLVIAFAGRVGGLCFVLGVFFGGFYPLYVLPWIRQRSRG